MPQGFMMIQWCLSFPPRCHARRGRNSPPPRPSANVAVERDLQRPATQLHPDLSWRQGLEHWSLINKLTITNLTNWVVRAPGHKTKRAPICSKRFRVAISSPKARAPTFWNLSVLSQESHLGMWDKHTSDHSNTWDIWLTGLSQKWRVIATGCMLQNWGECNSDDRAAKKWPWTFREP